MRYLACAILAVFIISGPPRAFAQILTGETTTQQAERQRRTTALRLGGYGNFSINWHNADFRALPGVPSCCPNFESGSGQGAVLGALFDMPLSDRFMLEIRLGYFNYSADLTRTETRSISINGVRERGVFEHEIRSNIATIGLEPLVSMPVYENLYVAAGVQVGVAVQQSYEQDELFVEPANRGVFENGTRIRNASSGDIPFGQDLFAALLLGLRYELPLDNTHTWYLTPEALFSVGLSPFVSDLSWSANTLRLGTAVRYVFDRTETPLPIDDPSADPNIPALTPDDNITADEIAPGGIDVGINVVSVLPGNRWRQVDTLRIEEFRVTKLHSVLSYVFFDEDNAELPARYRQLNASETESFRIEDLYRSETLDIYYQLLNVIGSRMRQRPGSSITLVGNTSDSGPERGNRSLAQRRAQTIARYLRDVWNIDPSRISIDARVLPEKPSNGQTPEGAAENRRVEIYASDAAILEPVIATNVYRYTSPPVLRLLPQAQPNANVRRWKATAQSPGAAQSAKVFEDAGTLPAFIDWNVEDEGVARGVTSLDFALAVQDAEQEYVAPVKSVTVEQISIRQKRAERRADKELGEYSVILFDYGTADFGAVNRDVVNQIAGLIKPGSRVMVRGYSDRLGDEAFNMRLSQQRAQTTADALKDLGVAVSGVESVGESELLFDNTLPEGRFYSRTVRVNVENDVGG